jgi:hypothetical protein
MTWDSGDACLFGAWPRKGLPSHGALGMVFGSLVGVSALVVIEDKPLLSDRSLLRIDKVIS